MTRNGHFSRPAETDPYAQNANGACSDQIGFATEVHNAHKMILRTPNLSGQFIQFEQLQNMLKLKYFALNLELFTPA